MQRKVISIWITFIMIISAIVILVEIAPIVHAPTTIYVGGAGGGNYSKIQWAIDNASTGDTVFVYNGTYFENIIIHKSLSLIGENTKYTIIDGSGGDRTVVISAPDVHFQNFTLTLSDSPSGLDITMDIRDNDSTIRNCIFSYVPNHAIYCGGDVNNTIIENNLFTGYYANGVRASGKYFTKNIIANNTFEGGGYGIVAYRVDHFDDVVIINNSFSGRGIWYGISMNLNQPTNSANNISIISNIFSEYEVGIFLYHTSNSTIFDNIIFDCTWYGIWMEEGCKNNSIYHNKLLNNNGGGIQARDTGDNLWNGTYPYGGNYWSDYMGVDNYQGPNQDLPGSDGIGDTNYTIDSDTVDYYPLIEPFNLSMPIHNIDKDIYYIRIQDAIDDADSGNTIFVSEGTYYENLIVGKKINLTGENKNKTIIFGNGTQDVILISGASYTRITGFTVTGNGPSSWGTGIMVSSVNCTISNNIITDHEIGIYLQSSGCNISNNKVMNNDNSILLEMVENNKIISNEVIYNYDCGIRLSSSNYNNISNNVVISNLDAGIDIINSKYDRFKGNKLIQTGFNIGGNEIEYWTTHDIDISNLVNGKPVYYWKNETSGNIPSGAGQIIIANCTNVTTEAQDIQQTTKAILMRYSLNVTISNSVFSNCNWGIYLEDVDNIKISNNTVYQNNGGILFYGSCDGNYISNNSIMNCNEGIYILSSDNNEINNNYIDSNKYNGISLWSCENTNITGNDIVKNNRGISLNLFTYYTNISNNLFYNNTKYAIYIEDSPNNLIYHNNIIKNNFQAYDYNSNTWDIGYPLGGNYWSDYNGVDLNGTLTQDVPPPDGIGDTPYDVKSDSQDNYPLMRPVGNMNFLHEGWNLVSIPFIQWDTNLSKILYNIQGTFDAVQWFNASDPSDPWKHNHTSKPSQLADLNNIDHTIGYWIHITEPGGILFAYPGTAPTSNQTIALHPGWNMVGFPSLTSHNRTVGLNNLTFDTHVDAIQWYDAATKIWHIMGPNDNFVPGRGYWVHSKIDVEWEVPI